MEVDCEGCAGCCIDWRPLVDGEATGSGDDSGRAGGEGRDSRGDGHDSGGGGRDSRGIGHDSAGDGRGVDSERRGRYVALDDAYNLAPLTRDEVRAFVDAGYGDALRPRLFAARGVDDGDRDDGAAGDPEATERTVTVDGVDLAAVAGRPAFYVGLRKPPKPVAPFGTESTWLRTCAFLDPSTLQCRLHDDDLHPETCATYPGANLLLDAETECERVERVHGGDRLLDDEPPADAEPRFGPEAVGTRVFAHPEPDRLDGVVDRLRAGRETAADRAELVAVAAGSSPATLAVSETHYERYRDAALSADSWVGRAVAAWRERAGAVGAAGSDPDEAARAVEDAEGAPATPGWDAVPERAGEGTDRDQTPDGAATDGGRGAGSGEDV